MVGTGRWGFTEVHANWAAAQRSSEFRGRIEPLALVAAALVIPLVLLKLEVKVQPARRGVVKDDAPLVELRAVVVKFVVARNEWPHVIAIATGVVRQERKSIRPFTRRDNSTRQSALCL